MKLIDLKTLSTRTAMSVFKLRKLAKMGMPHYRTGNKIYVNPKEFRLWFSRFKVGHHSVPMDLDRVISDAMAKFEPSSS
jgi:hypothetical protein